MENKIILYCRIYQGLTIHDVDCFFSQKEAEAHEYDMSLKDKKLIYYLDFQENHLGGLFAKTLDYLTDIYEGKDVLDFFSELVYSGFDSGKDCYHHWKVRRSQKREFTLTLKIESESEKFEEMLDSLYNILSVKEVNKIVVGVVFYSCMATFKLPHDNVFVVGRN